MVLYVSAIMFLETLETNARERVKVIISFPVKLGSRCCALLVYKEKKLSDATGEYY